jgi:5-oxoprolinase (ATP-hydrolysing) subunit A
MNSIDLNCDCGESYGAFQIGNDLAVMPHVTSVNIACGFHGGDPGVMRRTVAAARAHNVSIGAHPGLPDLVGFGRREMAIAPDDAYDMTLYQIGALQAIARAEGACVMHVKPHGALYNMAARSRPLADAIARATRDADPALRLVGLAGSALIDAGVAIGLAVANEVFADRGYRADGTLVPRTEPNAIISDVGTAVARAVAIVQTGRVATVDGASLALTADTICIHGDHNDAPVLAARLSAALRAAGATLRSFSAPN